MPKKPKVKALPSSKIPVERSEAKITFSFQYHDSKHDVFSLREMDIEYVYKILDRFKNLAEYTAGNLIGNGSRSLRCHPIRWEDTTQSGFGSISKELYDGCAYQIQISQGEGRIHGFFIGSVFYVVWFDPNHMLYKQKK